MAAAEEAEEAEAAEAEEVEAEAPPGDTPVSRVSVTLELDYARVVADRAKFDAAFTSDVASSLGVEHAAVRVVSVGAGSTAHSRGRCEQRVGAASTHGSCT